MHFQNSNFNVAAVTTPFLRTPNILRVPVTCTAAGSGVRILERFQHSINFSKVKKEINWLSPHECFVMFTLQKTCQTITRHIKLPMKIPVTSTKALSNVGVKTPKCWAASVSFTRLCKGRRRRLAPCGIARAKFSGGREGAGYGGGHCGPGGRGELAACSWKSCASPYRRSHDIVLLVAPSCS